VNITGARIALGPCASARRNLSVDGCRVRISEAPAGTPEVDLGGFLLLPGLINAHDHLEFNLLPRLGRGPYQNAREWARDIHRVAESPLKEHLSLPKQARLPWGGLKNLLSGVTTVAHHNPCDDPVFDDGFPVNVVKDFGWAHSLDFSPDIAGRFAATPADWPFILHAAEGVEARARAEVARLDELGVLTERTILVHALALDAGSLDTIRARRSSIVWCPTSNLSTYGETLSRSVLRSGVSIALGTDSAMTAQTDLIGEIEMARRTGSLEPHELYRMVTAAPARMLRLCAGQGTIRDSGVADLVAVADRGQTPADALLEMEPEMVMVGGRIRLITPRLLDRITETELGRLHAVTLEGRGSWLTDVDVTSLHEETEATLGAGYRLAGRRILQ
jgi:cytosine/adenosine deaminase-related metal-dependent hydrolase